MRAWLDAKIEEPYWGPSEHLGLSLSFSQVGGESNSLGFLCLLFFSYFPINVAGGCIRCSWGNIPL